MIYRFNAFSVKNSESYSVDIKKLIKFIWKGKRPRIENTIVRKEDKFGRLIFQDSKIYYKLW